MVWAILFLTATLYFNFGIKFGVKREDSRVSVVLYENSFGSASLYANHNEVFENLLCGGRKQIIKDDIIL
jgi:hypothetical protein